MGDGDMIDSFLLSAQLQKFSFIDDLHAELLRLVELRAGFFTGEHIVGFLAHGCPLTLPPRASIFAAASSRVIEGNVPVRTNVFPANLPLAEAEAVLMASFPGLIPSFIGGKGFFFLLRMRNSPARSSLQPDPTSAILAFSPPDASRDSISAISALSSASRLSRANFVASFLGGFLRERD